MGIILILVSAIITLVIGPTMTASSDVLRAPAMASSSVVICLISLNSVDMCLAEIDSSEIGVDCIEASASLCEASKLLFTALTIERSVAMILTWGSIIVIVVIIVRAIISIVFICPLGFWWVVSMTLRFSFRFNSTSGLFWFCTFKWWGYFPFFFVHHVCDM